jgi:hypothetical protein
MVNSEELVGTTEHVTLYARCHLNRCRYNRVRVCMVVFDGQVIGRVTVPRRNVKGRAYLHTSHPVSRCCTICISDSVFK